MIIILYYNNVIGNRIVFLSSGTFRLKTECIAGATDAYQHPMPTAKTCVLTIPVSGRMRTVNVAIGSFGLCLARAESAN